jgi:uncharacterized phage-associated protein
MPKAVGKRYDPLAIANEFIARAAPRGISHMKLQKLVYMTLGKWLAEHDESLLDENPEVWQYGPVFASLYHELKSFKSQAISEPQTFFEVAPRVDDKEALAVIEKVWEKYREMPAAKLSDITHLPGSPWHQIAKDHGFKVPMGTEIDPEVIRKYFRATANMEN